MKGQSRIRGLVAITLLGGCFSKPPGPVAESPDGGGELGDVGNKDAPDDTNPTGPNYMFVTSSTWTGNELKSPTDADKHCQDAAAGKLPGTFKAWMSAETPTVVHAQTRLGTARGWVRPDGEPFADTVDALATGIIFYPPRIDENKNDLPNVPVFTGTDPNGFASGDDCNANAVATVGLSDAAFEKWTNTYDGACAARYHLYCFGTDHAVTVKAPALPMGAKVAFVSELLGVKTSPSDLDTLCTNGALNNGLPGMWVAFVARTNAAARSLLPVNAGGWYRPDGVQIAADMNFVGFRAPINVTSNGLYVGDASFSGASNVDTMATAQGSCQNWTTANNADVHVTGDVQRSASSAFSSGAAATCQTNNRLYCFQL